MFILDLACLKNLISMNFLTGSYGFESEYMHERCCYHLLQGDKQWWIVHVGLGRWGTLHKHHSLVILKIDNNDIFLVLYVLTKRVDEAS